MIPLPSIGTAATRWLTNVSFTTTSAPSNTVGLLAEVELDGQVRTVFGEEERSVVGERRLGVDDDREWLVVDDHLLGCVDRLRPGLGDDRGDDVADEAHAVLREHRPGEDRGEHDEALDRLEAEVVAGVDGDDAGHRDRVRGVDAVTSAWAIVDRTNTTWSMPSMARSSKYFAPPSRIFGSSRRRTAWPRIDPDADMRAPALSATAAIYLRAPIGTAGQRRRVGRDERGVGTGAGHEAADVLPDHPAPVVGVVELSLELLPGPEPELRHSVDLVRAGV